MGDIVNLNRARKKKRAADEKKTAEENRARFGRTKADQARDRLEKERAGRALAEHEIENDER